MIVSWNWLKEYVPLAISAQEFAERMMMAGLNHESTQAVGDDLAIDLEVTSNRPDCLGHLGVAREAAALFGLPLALPAASPRESAEGVAELASVSVECPDLCPRYTARVLRGVRVGPSPAWLSRRLATIGVASINNVVDVTNYVLFESGQPLHAFDLARIARRRVVVRRSRAGDEIEAIDHKRYTLPTDAVVIADEERPLAIGGVMGGAFSEVTRETKDILLESAIFDPRATRATARRLALHSPSSYRFERGLDPEGVDWSSRRALELIQQVAGGNLASGVLDVGAPAPPRSPIVLRFSRLQRVLGIEIEPKRAREILVALGLEELSTDAISVSVSPPTWRADLTREIDLVEEVARVHGYDKIPEDVSVPMAASARSDEDRVLERIRRVLTALGFDEALTVSVVEEDWSEAFSPWTDSPPLLCQTPVLRRADRLRRSLVPSLMGARRVNDTLANPDIELFEIARVYLPSKSDSNDPSEAALPSEEPMLALASGRDFHSVKGVLESVLAELNPSLSLEPRECRFEFLDRTESCELWLDGRLLGFMGKVSASGLKRFESREGATIAEIRVAELARVAQLVATYVKQPTLPAITRDLNFVVGDSIRWSDLSGVVKSSAGACLERLDFKGVFRDPVKLGPGKKSILLSMRLRSADATLTGQQADKIQAAVIQACKSRLDAELRG